LSIIEDSASSSLSEISPVGWYVGSYLLRFVELNENGNDNPAASFYVWENTIIVRAGNFEEAYRKVVLVGERQTDPYLGGPDGIPVQWVFEGVSELLPIYEPLEDGAEIMWADRGSVPLGKLRERAKSLEELKKHLRRDDE
jgi:hypothetical protein